MRKKARGPVSIALALAYLALCKRPFELPEDASDTLESFFRNVRSSLNDPGNKGERTKHWAQNPFHGVVDRSKTDTDAKDQEYFNPLKSILRVFGEDKIWWAEGFNPEILRFQVNNQRASDEDLQLFVETVLGPDVLLQLEIPKPTVKGEEVSVPRQGPNDPSLTADKIYARGEPIDVEFFGRHERIAQLPTDVPFWEFRPPKDVLRAEGGVISLTPVLGTVRLAAPLTDKKKDIDAFITTIIETYGDKTKTREKYWELLFHEKYPFLVGEDDRPGKDSPLAQGMQAIDWLRSDLDSGLEKSRMHNIESYLLTKTREDDDATIVADWNARQGLGRKRKHSAFRWNGRNFMLAGIQKQVFDEHSIYECTFCDSDYYTYRCVADCSDSILTHFDLRKKLGQGHKRLQTYLANPHLIHGGFGVAVVVRTSDNMLVIRKRSEGAADFGEANKWYMSANEGLRADQDVEQNSSGTRVMKPCIEIVKRALRKELVGERFPLDERTMKSCYLTGVLLYLPNLSVNLCFLVELGASFEEVKMLASQAEHEREFRPMEGDDAPLVRFRRADVCEFVAGTRQPRKDGQGPYAEEWDEGSLVAIRLAYPPEKFGLV
jgi:hypothetical protein